MKWELEKIENAFIKIESEGWDTKSPLKWGFTFFAKTQKELKMIYDELEGYGYSMEKLEYREDLTLWILYVTKVETLQPTKLHNRNISFEELANYYKIDCYDSWDVVRI